MEHLSMEVAAARLRLIASKNEKSRGELGRFLAKQVREYEEELRASPSHAPAGPGEPHRAGREASGVLLCLHPGRLVAEAASVLDFLAGFLPLAPSTGVRLGRQVCPAERNVAGFSETEVWGYPLDVW